MDTPASPEESVVFTQNITATHGGRAYAVQNGDQYIYIYRGTPPYRVEPFPLAEQAAVPHGLMRVPSRLLTARHQVVPFLPRPELAQLESWREDGTPGLSVRLMYAEGGSGKTRLAAEFAAHSATAGWAVALARHRSEVASAGGGDQTLAVRAPGLVLVVDYAERWPLEDLITLVRQHQDAARDRLRILLLSRQAGNWWQSLKHQLAKLDVLNVNALRLEGLPETEGARAEMYTAARDRFTKEYKKTLAPSSKEYKRLDASRIGVPDDLTDQVFGLTLTVHMRALVDVDAASRGKTPPTGSGQASLSSYLLDREHDHWRSFHHQGSGPLRTPEQTMGRAVYVATLTGPLPPADAAAALTRTRAADTPAAGEQLAEEHARCYPPTEPALVLDPLYPDRLGEDYLALTMPGHEEEFGYHATDSWTITTPTALLAPAQVDGRPALYTRHAMLVMIEAGIRWPHLTTQHLAPLLRRHPALALAAGGAALTRLADLDSLDITVLDAIRLHFPTSRHTELDAGIAAITARLARHHLATTHDPAARAGIYENLSKRQSYAGLHDEALIAGQDAVKAWRDLTHTNPTHQPDLARSLSNLGGELSAVGRREEALAAAEEAVGIRRGLAEGNPTAYNPALATSLSNLSAGLSAVGRRSQALAAAEEALEIRRGLAEGNPTAHLPDLATSLSNLSIGLWEAGRREEALAAAEEAVGIRRGLAEGNPTAHLPDLAAAMNNFGIGLWAVGRREEALAAAEEAVGIRRGLAEGNPTAHLPDLA
ncbi:tetratricopeptide repeat protein, partial [Streptomyces europaeiscabiei]|uniref:tetratricopeptide repeat protein n=1 Tax=Streptomyces europaeiscabiei TaxID=146819 RepID=UPI0029BF5A49